MTTAAIATRPADYRRQYRPEEGIRHSYADTTRNYVTPGSASRQIRYGDRLFVRLEKEGRTVLNCMIDKVNDLTELYGEIRYLTRELRGLCMLHLRNASRGWSMDRPLKLYGALSGPRQPGAVAGQRSVAGGARPAVAVTATARPRREAAGMEWSWWGQH